MTILIDQPIWPAHDTVWGHLVSDESLVAQGAQPVTVREMVTRLRSSGLRVTQREKRGL